MLTELTLLNMYERFAFIVFDSITKQKKINLKCLKFPSVLDLEAVGASLAAA